MRLLVCGSRDFDASWWIHEILDDLHEEYKVTILIHGDAKGADTIANGWAEFRDIDILKYRADWKTHGRAAGPVRNRKMLNIGKPDLVVAFTNKSLTESHGTRDMVLLAEHDGLPVHLYTFL